MKIRCLPITNKEANLIVVTHGVVLRCFLLRWYHWTVEYFDSRPALPNCHIAVMTRGGDGAFALSEPFADVPCLLERENECRR